MFCHISNSYVLFFYCCLLLKWDENHKHKKYYCTQHVISSHEAKQIQQVGDSQMQEICTHYEIFTHGPNKLSRWFHSKARDMNALCTKDRGKANGRDTNARDMLPYMNTGQTNYTRGWHKCKRYVHKTHSHSYKALFVWIHYKKRRQVSNVISYKTMSHLSYHEQRLRIKQKYNMSRDIF